jgi:DNA-3-methyladenine glycosylase II
MGPIRTEDDIRAGLAELIAIDPRFGMIAEKAGPVPLRYQPPGFSGLASIIVAQMVSRASANAIWARLEGLTGEVTGKAILARSPEDLRAIGLSGAKEIALRSLANACELGLDLEAAAGVPAKDAIAALTAVKGIGLWTAEVFMLFSAGHPDIFPGGDVALQNAAAHALCLEKRPSPRELQEFALRWRPVRSIAARLLWAYYAREVRRDVAPVAEKQQS